MEAVTKIWSSIGVRAGTDGTWVHVTAETKIGPETEVRLGTDGTWVTAKTVKGLFAAPVEIPAAVVPAAAATPAQAAALNNSAVGEEELLRVYPSYLRNDPIGFCFL